jgi:hypothetical protein
LLRRAYRDKSSLPGQQARLIDLSPDGSALLVGKIISDVPSAQELWVEPLLAGAPRRLGNLLADGGVSATWSSDGRQLNHCYKGELHIARSDGTELRKLATVVNPDQYFRWSHDGGKVRFSMLDEKSGKYSLWEVSVSSGAMRWTGKHLEKQLKRPE